MGKVLGAVLVGALFAATPSFAYAAPYLGLTTDTVYYDDTPFVDYDWVCSDLGWHNGGFFTAIAFQEYDSQFNGWGDYAPCDTRSHDDFVYSFEAVAGDYWVHVVVYDDTVADDYEDYSPWDYHWLTQPGAPWLATSTSIWLEADNRP